MAYKGGAMLAFALDVALRERGGLGALMLVRDLLEGEVEEVSLPALRGWLEEHELEGFWEDFVEEAASFEAHEYLERIGYEAVQGEGGLRLAEPGDGLDGFFTSPVGDG